MSKTEDNAIEKRKKEIYETTQTEGWRHIRALFIQKLLELKSIDSLASYSEADLFKQLEIHRQVAFHLESIVRSVDIEGQSYTQETLDEIKIYGFDEFGEN